MRRIRSFPLIVALVWLSTQAAGAGAACYRSAAEYGDDVPDDAVADADGTDGTVPRVDADVDSDDDRVAESEVVDPGEAADEADADATDVPPPPEACINPPSGPAGAPCMDDVDCASGFLCYDEQSWVLEDEVVLTDPGGYCATYGRDETVCDPDDPASCGESARCIYLGRAPTGEVYHGCLDACDAFTSDGALHADNCDCRDGYECDPLTETCETGCSIDLECCAVWRYQPWACYPTPCPPYILFDASECTNRCDRATWRCVNAGCPSGSCSLGDPCIHDSQCPPRARCALLRAPMSPGDVASGICVQDFCERPSWPCPAGARCLAWEWPGPSFACFRTCTPYVPSAESGCVPGTACHLQRDVAGGFSGGCQLPCFDDASCLRGSVCDPVSEGCVIPATP